MKALSIRQPFAWLICAGYKDIENRRWPTKFRGRIYVHTSMQFDYDGFNWVCRNALRLPPLDVETFAYIALYPPEGVVGEVDIVDCVTESKSPWFEGPFGFVLANPVLYEQPIPMRGRLGLWEVQLPEDVGVR